MNIMGKHTKIDEKEILRLLAAGFSWDTIQIQCNCSRMHIARVKKRNEAALQVFKEQIDDCEIENPIQSLEITVNKTIDLILTQIELTKPAQRKNISYKQFVKNITKFIAGMKIK